MSNDILSSEETSAVSGQTISEANTEKSAPKYVTLEEVEKLVEIKANKIASIRINEFKSKMTPQEPMLSPQIKADSARIKDLEEALSKMHQQAKSSKLDSILSEHLSSVGVTDARAQTLAKTFLKSQNLVDYSEEHGAFFNTSEGPLTIDSGLSQWVDQNKFLQSPKPIAGGGSVPSVSNHGNKKQESLFDAIGKLASK